MYEAPERPAEADASRMAAHSDTVLFAGAPDVDTVYAYLRSKGVAVQEPVIRDYGMKQALLKEPDAYGICLQWPAA